VNAKAAFRGHVGKDGLNYNPDKGFSIGRELMDQLNIDHQVATSYQRNAFRELEKSGRPNNMREHTKIAVDALVAGGADIRTARGLVAESLQNLRSQGVREPTRIPWSRE
jgi:hypothetical protein